MQRETEKEEAQPSDKIFAELGYEGHYARCHQFTDEYYETMRADYEHTLCPLLPKDKKAEILDVGCGTGFAVNALLKAGYINTRGIDSTPGLVEIARSRNLPVEFVGENETERFLSSNSNTLDAAFLFEVLEHLEYDRQLRFLSAVRESLNPTVSSCAKSQTQCV